MLDTLAREADLAVGGAMAGVYLLDDDGTALATAGHNCPDEWFGYRLGARRGHRRPGARDRTAGDDGGVRRGRRRCPPTSSCPGVRSGVGVPMCWNGELRGALSIGFLDRREVTRDDLDVLEAIADLAVVACHNAEAYDDVRTAASTDALTGLLNHGAMQVRVREEIARAARDGQPLCCVLIDLDDFKRVNDELGHPAGDALLRRVADALRAEVRPVRPGRPLRRRRVRARAARHRGERRARRRRARARARPHRRPARRRRRARQLLDRRLVVGRRR